MDVQQISVGPGGPQPPMDPKFCRLVDCQKMRGSYSLLWFPVEVGVSQQIEANDHVSNMKVKTATNLHLLSHTQPTFFGIDLSGWTSLSLLVGGDFILEATPAAIFCYIPCEGNS